MREQHYLGFRNFCGNCLLQVAVLGERWLALSGWHASALHCAARYRWIGWTSLQRRQRLFLVADQSRFLLLTEAGRSPHLASRVLGLSLRQLPVSGSAATARPSACSSTRCGVTRGSVWRPPSRIRTGSLTAPGSCSAMPNSAPCTPSSTKSLTPAAAAACAILCARR